MENELIRTDKVMYKIRRFFLSLFIRNNSQIYNEEEMLDSSVNDLDLNKIISCRTETETLKIKEELARKLMEKEMSIDDLTDEEVDEMIQFFKKDIEEKGKELFLIKKQIVVMKKEQANKNN